MKPDHTPRSPLAHTSLRDFFDDSVTQALHNQQVEAERATVTYVVNLLTIFSRSENLFEPNEGGIGFKPLALHYRDAVDSETAFERSVALQRLGDCALFIAGLFADSLRRKVVDVDYYVGMGGTAYASLADLRSRRLNEAALGEIFAELSEKFVTFVDVLNEVGQGMSPPSDADLLRLYDVWVRTGSERARKRLLEHGMQLSHRPADDKPH
jgi:hypothetical protein